MVIRECFFNFHAYNCVNKQMSSVPGPRAPFASPSLLSLYLIARLLRDFSSFISTALSAILHFPVIHLLAPGAANTAD